MRSGWIVTTALAGIVCCYGGGCVRVKVDPVEVKPITLNVNLKVDRELDDFFAFEQELAPATTLPTTAPDAPSTRPVGQ